MKSKVKSERSRIENLATWYSKEQLDIDKQLIYFGYKSIKPYFRGSQGLELGTGDGQMTKFLLKDFEELTVVDGAAKLLDNIPDAPNLIKIHSLFEELSHDRKYDSIIMAHILEHIEKPKDLLILSKKWLKPKGRIFIIVPNGNSFHRLAAVKMGLLKHPCELNERDYKLGHRRVYIKETLTKDIKSAGLFIYKIGGIFFKPLSNRQIQDHWTKEMIDGFYELGKDFPEYAAEIYAICTIKK